MLGRRAPQRGLEDDDVEVDQQADRRVGEAQVRHDLRLVDRQQPFDRLELDEDPAVDDDVESIAASRRSPLHSTGSKC